MTFAACARPLTGRTAAPVSVKRQPQPAWQSISQLGRRGAGRPLYNAIGLSLPWSRREADLGRCAAQGRGRSAPLLYVLRMAQQLLHHRALRPVFYRHTAGTVGQLQLIQSAAGLGARGLLEGELAGGIGRVGAPRQQSFPQGIVFLR